MQCYLSLQHLFGQLDIPYLRYQLFSTFIHYHFLFSSFHLDPDTYSDIPMDPSSMLSIPILVKPYARVIIASVMVIT